MCLADVLAKDSTIHRAYIVIGGDGWTKHQFFLNDLNDWVNTNEFVDVVRLDSFVAKANQGNVRAISNTPNTTDNMVRVDRRSFLPNVEEESRSNHSQ